MMRTTMFLGLALVAALFAFPGSGADLSGPATDSEPTVIVHEFDGKLVCQVRSGVPGCPKEAGQRLGETFKVNFTGVQGVLLEMDWTPPAPAVNGEIGMNSLWNTVAGGDGSAATSGAAVLRLYLEKGADNNTFCLEGCPGMETRARAPLPGAVQGGQISYNAFQPIGLPVVNQEFTIYVSFFVGQNMPAGYSAIPAAPPSNLPGAPTSLSATPGTTVALSWGAASGDVDAYRIYRGDSGLTAGLKLLGQVSGTTTGFSDATCKLGSVCTYTVAGVNEFGQGPNSDGATVPGLA